MGECSVTNQEPCGVGVLLNLQDFSLKIGTFEKHVIKGKNEIMLMDGFFLRAELNGDLVS